MPFKLQSFESVASSAAVLEFAKEDKGVGDGVGNAI